jgi:hypothetical protein
VKILANEAIFSSNELCNRTLLYEISDALTHLLTHSADYCLEPSFVDEFINELIVNPISQLEEKWLKNCKGDAAFNHSKSAGEQEIETPNIEITLWLIQVLNRADKKLANKIRRFSILFKIIGLIPHVKGNKELVWGML